MRKVSIHKHSTHSGVFKAPHRAEGFIQGVLLFGIALLAVVIAAFSSSNKSVSNSTDSEQAKTVAATIITHGGSLKVAIERFRIDRGDLNTMDFSSTFPNGLFNTTDSFVSQLTVPGFAYVSGTAPTGNSPQQNGSYYLRSGTNISVGGNSNVSHLVSTTGLTQRTCQRINVSLHGSTFISTIPATTAGTVADFQGGAGAITIPTFTSVNNLEEGCVSVNGTHVYFKVVSRSQ